MPEDSRAIDIAINIARARIYHTALHTIYIILNDNFTDNLREMRARKRKK